MSELKYNELAERFAPFVEKSICAGATAVMVPSETGCWVHYVDYCERIAEVKSEADKVIANRDDEIKKLKGSIDRLLKAKTEQIIHEVIQKTLIYGEGFIRVEDAMKLIAELRRHKYKRCLAMAYVEWLKQMNLCNFPESILYRRAYRRERKWKELAEKFKEG